MRFETVSVSLILFLLLSFAGFARADCVDPEGEAGKLIFRDGAAVVQYCNGTEWISFPKASGLGVSGGCPDIGAWTAHTAAEANLWQSVAYGSGLFVAVALTGTNQVMTSPDGVDWTARAAAEANFWQSVTYGDGLFVAVALSGTNRVMTSPDGINWMARAAAAASWWQSVTYGNGLFVAVAQSGPYQVMTSPDGIDWTAQVAAEANLWQSVTYGDGLFVAVASSGTNRVMTSPDGINWTAHEATEANQWVSVTYGNGLFVAVAQDGTNRVMTSPDGVNWTARAAAEANQWRSVAYGDGLFVATASSGANRVMTSPDGIDWTARAAAEASNWISVTHANGLFVAVANSGTDRVMTAECASPGCQSPDMAAGQMLFNADHRVLQWCDGNNWQAAGPVNPTGSNDGCENPSKPRGFLLFNRAHCVLQYCDGDTWRGVGRSDPCACDPDAGAATLAAHWTFDEGAGPTAADSSGNGYTGTLSSPPPAWTTSSRIGPAAIDFNGDFQLVEASYNSNYSIFTLSAWIYPRTFGEDNLGGVFNRPNIYQLTVCSGDAVCGGLSNTLRFNTLGDANNGQWYAEANAITLNAWNHIAITYDGTSAANDPVMYINGVPTAVYEYAAPTGPYGPGIPYPLRMGEGSHNFDGMIDDARIYHGALSASQVQILYDTGDIALCP